MATYEIGVEDWRGAAVENVHAVDVAVVKAEGAAPGKLVASFGDPDGAAYLRSSCKPFIAYAAWLCGEQKLGVEPRSTELAIQCASHGATRAQVAAARRVLALAGKDESALENGYHEPLSKEGREILKAEGGVPSAIHGNCSGKHAELVAACVALGIDNHGYRLPGHPLMARVRAQVAECMGLKIEDMPEGVDGCGLPIWSIPMRNAAWAFGQLGGDLRLIGDTMSAHPELIGSPEAFNVQLMQAIPGTVAKDGAEGVFCMSFLDEKLGVAFKIKDGTDRCAAPIMIAILEQLGKPIPASLEPFREPIIKNLLKEPVGTVKATLRLKMEG